ncbi:SMC5-SMC6 complex localization factor protein 1 [Apodemus speciosus]|uniref:SMC5-SMC6 complex localization factor protein 1 n=1 Tax=Apodemus speciosus TaxID=105296 RepID=A0ABQ0FGL3_APOSI
MEDSATKHIIQMTGFKMEEKEALVKLLLKLDCTFIKSENIKTVHILLLNGCAKSEKFLAACAAGKWVLTKDYIIHSAKSGRWLDETTYEWGYKIEKDSHYSPQMQSAPKRWREELKRTGAPGAFHRWKVVLLVRADKRSDSLVRVLEAGKANVILPKNSPSGITHVIASNARISAEREQENFKAPFYPIQYLGDFLLEVKWWKKEIQNDEDSQISSGWTKYNNQEKSKHYTKDVGFLEMKGAGKNMYRTQNKIENQNENVNDRFVLSEHHKKKFRDFRKDIKSVKKRNAFRRHGHENQKEMKNSLLTDCAKESKTKDVKINVDLAEVKNALKKQIYRDIYRAQAVRYNCIRIDKQPVYNVEVKNSEFPRGILNLIESLIEGQFFKEAIEELSSLQAHYIPPVCLLHALLENVLQDKIDTFSGRYFHILSALLHLHPPWKSPAMLRYYLELFQCPTCMKGAWALVEVLIRSCLFNEGFCHQISENIGSKVVHLTLLKFFFNLLEGEVRHLSQKLCDWSDSQSLKVTEKAILHEIFWSGSESSGLLTKPVNMLLEWTIYSHKEKCKSTDSLESGDSYDPELLYLRYIFAYQNILRGQRHATENVVLPEDNFQELILFPYWIWNSGHGFVFKHELSYLLTGILGAAVDYWIFLGIQMGRNVIRHMSDDLGSYISLSCDDSYLPVLGKMDIHGAGKIQMPKKLCQRTCLESQRALLMLNGAKQKQAEGRPELLELNRAKCSSSLKKLKKKSEGELACSKENCPSLVTKMNFHKTNLKGETALHRVCIKNQVEKLIILLSLPGIDINVKDNAGWTPLHEACNYGNTECVQEILQRCPEVDLLTQVDGVTPLHDALSNGHVEIGKLLLQHGGPELLQQRNSKGELPLDYVLSPKDKEELFAITNIDDTVDNFHAKTQKLLYHQQLEFGSFLLSRMLINFCSIFDLSSEFILAFKGLGHLNELLMACNSDTEPSNAHADWLLDVYAKNIKTLKKLPSVLKELPENLNVCPGVHTEALLVTLKMMCQSITEVS